MTAGLSTGCFSSLRSLFVCCWVRVNPSFARMSLPKTFRGLCSTTSVMLFVAVHDPEFRTMWIWTIIGMFLLLKHLSFIYPLYSSNFMCLSFSNSFSAVLMSMKLRGDPVSGNQLSVFLIFSVIFMIISPCGVALFSSEFLMFLKSLSIRLILFQYSVISSVMYIVGSGSIVSVLQSSSSRGGSIVCLSSSFIFFTFLVCVWCLCGYCPLFFGSGGICDLHIFAKCPGFLQMFKCDNFAMQLLLWLSVNDPPHFQHCGCCFVFGVGRMAGFIFWGWKCAIVVFQLELFPLNISFWFCWPRSRAST